MNNMKMMNVFLVATALFFGMASASAQTKTAKEKATNNATILTKALGLTSDQAEKVKELYFTVASKNEVIRNDKNMSAKLKEESLYGNNFTRMSYMKDILNETQMKKLSQIEEAKKKGKPLAGTEKLEDL
jgi:hypothetical protein